MHIDPAHDEFAVIRERPYPCGRWTMRGTNDKETRYHRVNCKCWGCVHCGPRKAGRYKHAIRAQAEKHKLDKFWTFTLDPKTVPAGVDSTKHIARVWAQFRVYLLRHFRREYPRKKLKFIRVLEYQKITGLAHYHVLLNEYVPQEWVKKTWQTCGGGMHVYVEQIRDLHRIGHYLSKYLTKELLMSAPKRSRRVTVSRGIVLNEKTKTTHTWRLIKWSITGLLEQWAEAVASMKFDADEQLESFVVPMIHTGVCMAPALCT